MEARAAALAGGLLETVVAVAESSPGLELRGQLDDWLSQGLIDAGHAARIEAAEAARVAAAGTGPGSRVGASGPARRAKVRRLPLIVEALGYVGAVFAVVAGLIAVRQLWPTITAGSVLAFAGVTAAVLLLVGGVLRIDANPPFERLRSVMWLASTAGFAVFAGLLVGTGFWNVGPGVRALVAEAGVTVYAVLLWWRSRATLQHLAAFVATAALAATGIDKAWSGSQPWGLGLGVWVLSLLWAGAVHRGYLSPPTAGYVAAGIGLLVGAQLTMDRTAGRVLAAMTVAGLLAAGVAARRLLLVGLGAVGAVVVLPQLMSRYLHTGAGAAVAVFAVGLFMLGVALWLARSR